ncbi:MAG TPA: long-chain fatty acid--CoA ligase [Jiangellales bacterium]|nr:long-chain fatty acid--CoA ligase [Jiangellales bacterium]
MTDAITDTGTIVAQRPASVGRMFADRAAATPTREAFRYPQGTGWSAITWQETKDRADAIAAGLIALGVEPEQRVAIASATRIEWVLADLAIMCAGAATTTIYPSTLEDDVVFILSDSESRVVFAENEAQLAKVAVAREKLPDVQKVVLFDGEGDGDWVMSLADLERLGAEHLERNPDAITQVIDKVTHDHLATLMYTSGTTGRPKGVRLTHGNWTYEAVAIDHLKILNADDVQYLWLPLSHSLGKVLQVMQLQIGFISAVDGRVDKIVDNLAVIKPTFMGAPPRIYEKVMGKVVSTTEQEGGAKVKIFHWALGVGRKVSEQRRQGREPGFPTSLEYTVADKLVFSKLKARMGGNIRYFISGGAALSRDIAVFFHGAGLLILEGYGLTETSAFSFVNRPDNYEFGTVGQPAPGTEVRIADDGEILIKGPGVMTGYHNMPEQTAEVLGADGWFHTGDIGELTPKGNLKITDRKKDLIKTSGGKYVAPQAIEVLFKAVCPYASQMVVHGEHRKFVTALITLDPDAIGSWAEHNDLVGTQYAELVSTPQVRELIQGYVEELNSRLARHEQIKKFEILRHDLTIEDGHLTPSLKVKRKHVEKQYMETFDKMYVE